MIEKLSDGSWLVNEGSGPPVVLHPEVAEMIAKTVIGTPSVTRVFTNAFGALMAELSNGTFVHLAFSDEVGELAKHIASLDIYREV